ncbi:MAG TPA: pyruvate kinase [Firmicutes bacterium]|nr:pyruvate kinase [Bacillota bacterium]
MRRTKIVATLGPSTDPPEVLSALIEAGMDVARINMSHGTPEEHGERMARVREAAERLGRHVGIMIDVAGPKIRTGPVAGGAVDIETGSIVILTTRPLEGNEHIISVGYERLPESVKPGSVILLSDGLIELKVEEVRGEDVTCRVTSGGRLGSRKGVTLPGVPIDLPALTEKDIANVRLGLENGADFVAASFIRKAQDVAAVKDLIQSEGGHADVIAKIESSEGVNNLEEIVRIADGVMVARGDLGVETPPERVPLVQKTIVGKCNRAGKPVIIATEMLESMIHNPRPTRAEVTDVANAILDGTDAIMLSGETAVGSYPVQAVKMMARIAEATEDALRYEEMLYERRAIATRTVADAISHAACQASHDLDIKAILTSTQSGATARMASKYRPRVPIVAVTPNADVARKLALVWGVHPVTARSARNIDDMLDIAVEAGLSTGIISRGDVVAITAGVRTGVPGTTNLIKIHKIE